MNKFNSLVNEERINQDKQWGGIGHDQMHNRKDWLDYINYQLKRIEFLDEVSDEQQIKERLVKVAALCSAYYDCLMIP